jgi:putative thioredoxin
MPTGYIVDVNEADFEYEVINFSKSTPVVVDFWATWCVPCRTLSPILERLADEAHGAFRLARVDVDPNPNLAMRYGVRSIPSVKAFQNGQVVAEFTGLQPEVRIRDFLRNLAPSASDLMVEKGNSLLGQQKWGDAERSFRKSLDQAPGSSAGLLGLAKAQLAQGHREDAEKIINHFPSSREYAAAMALMPLLDAMKQYHLGKLPDENGLFAAYRNCLRLITKGNILAALDGLLDIMKQDKQFMSGQARQVFLALLEILGPEDATSRQYRSELAAILF